MNKIIVRMVFTLLCIIGTQNVVAGNHGKGDQSAPHLHLPSYDKRSSSFL